MAVFWLEMFHGQLPLARARVKQLYGHSGGVFSETSYVWVSVKGSQQQILFRFASWLITSIGLIFANMGRARR